MALCPVYILYRNTHVRDKSRKKNLIFGTYKPSSINNGSFLNQIYNAITFYSTLYKNCVLLGKFEYSPWLYSIIKFQWVFAISEAAHQRCSHEKVFRKSAANLQENTHVELWYGCSPVNLLHIFRTFFWLLFEHLIKKSTCYKGIPQHTLTIL